MKTQYTIDYFINKFSNIPAKNWCTGTFKIDSDKFCALGHCGSYWKRGLSGIKIQIETEESKALGEIFLTKSTSLIAAANVNDGLDSRFQQKTPKARILAALDWLKE